MDGQFSHTAADAMAGKRSHAATNIDERLNMDFALLASKRTGVWPSARVYAKRRMGLMREAALSPHDWRSIRVLPIEQLQLAVDLRQVFAQRGRRLEVLLADHGKELGRILQAVGVDRD